MSDQGFSPGASGVSGPASSTDNASTRFDGTTGQVLQDSLVLTDDLGNMTGVKEITASDIPLYKMMGNELATSILDGGELTIDAGLLTFSVTDGQGMIIDQFTDRDNPSYTSLTWSGLTLITPKDAATETIAYIAIQESATPGVGEVVQQSFLFTRIQRKSLIVLGTVASPAGASIIATGNDITVVGGSYLCDDLADAIGRLNLSGNKFTAGGANLTLQRSAGVTFERSSNFYNNQRNANNIVSSSDSAVSFTYGYSDGSGGTTVVPLRTDINPGQYDDGSGTLATVANNKWTNQLILSFPDANAAFVQYGQILYSSFDAAKAGIFDEGLLSLVDTAPDAVRTVLTVEEGTTDLTSLLTEFSQMGKFGYAGGGGVTGAAGSQDYQQTYNLSIPPSTLTDATGGAVEWQQGSGADTDDVVRVLNGAGEQVFAVTGEGIIEGLLETRSIAFSDETTDFTTGTAKVTFAMPNYASTLEGVIVSVTDAPTGSVATFDLKQAGTTVLSVKVTIDAGEFNSETAATPPVISNADLAANAQMSVDIDGIGTTLAGKGGKIYLTFKRKP